ncbi:MAG: formate--tetrahydrofolate ligase [Myxococcota bacterium]
MGGPVTAPRPSGYTRRGGLVIRRIGEVAAALGLAEADWDGWGPDRAKLTLDAVHGGDARGKLVLVSAITPTPAGEGKTTTAIGLVQSLVSAGQRAVVCLREPSLGPVFGAKGGGTGGGAARLHPAAAIDLHFTGDLHAITSANNLLAAMVDANLFHGGPPALHPGRVVWRRVLDVNDRALREVVTGLGSGNGVPREAAFDITAASEVMAALCLASSLDDLRVRLGRMIVGFDPDGHPVTADALGATGALTALLVDAARPNLVQAEGGAPALVHGGPFANIAHGCSSVLGTIAGLGRADLVVTEAGFGFDLGGEKFFDIKCRSAGLNPSLVVLVVTVRALRWHGGGAIDAADPGAVERGLENLAKHVDSARAFGVPVAVAINRRDGDEAAERATIGAWCDANQVPWADADPFGGSGCADLAALVVERTRGEPPALAPLYPLDADVPAKIERIATAIYGAGSVVFSRRATADLQRIRRVGLDRLPVCLAKTPMSLSDDPALRGRPRGFPITVQEVRINAGAGFLVGLLGEIVRMPGLPKRPNARDIDVVDGAITGLYK